MSQPTITEQVTESATDEAAANPSRQNVRRRPGPHRSDEPAQPKYVIKARGEEAKAYDFAANRTDIKTVGHFASMGHLIKGCLGAGIVSMHENYKTSGLWSALVLNVFLGLLVTYCVHILLKSSQKMYGLLQIPKMTYPDLAEAAFATSPFPRLRKFSKCARYAVDVTIMIDLFGSCCVYMVVIARSIKQLYEGTTATSDDGIRIYIIILLVPVILITWILELKYLAPFSVIGDIFIIFVAISTVVYGTQAAKDSPTDLDVFPLFKSFGGVFSFMGACVFSMEGVGVSMAIENHLAKPKRYLIFLCGGMAIVIVMVMLVGFFGYWGFGEKAKAPVTLNFPLGILPNILKVGMAIMTYITFALNFWVPFELAWFYIKKKYTTRMKLWERVWRSIFVIAITIIAIALPNVSSFVGLLGAFCLSNMGFIYPAFIELLMNWEEPGLGFMKFRLIKAAAIMIFGAVLCVIGTYESFYDLIINVYGKK